MQLLREKLSSNMFVSVISEILGLFINTMTADGKYSLRVSQNLRQPI